MDLLILLVLSLIWVTWVARILADHRSRRRWAAACPIGGPPALGNDLTVGTGGDRIESLDPLKAAADGLTAGSVEAIDPVGLSLVLHTDDARLQYVVLSDAGMLAGLTHGDRILLCLNAAGRPWLLRKVEPAFQEVLRQYAVREPAGAAMAAPSTTVRHGGMEKLVG
jgi:hypothetical protein